MAESCPAVATVLASIQETELTPPMLASVQKKIQYVSGAECRRLIHTLDRNSLLRSSNRPDVHASIE